MTASANPVMLIGWLPIHWELYLNKELSHASQPVYFKAILLSRSISLFFPLFFSLSLFLTYLLLKVEFSHYSSFYSLPIPA
jgi:hypothetical protein